MKNPLDRKISDLPPFEEGHARVDLSFLYMLAQALDLEVQSEEAQRPPWNERTTVQQLMSNSTVHRLRDQVFDYLENRGQADLRQREMIAKEIERELNYPARGWNSGSDNLILQGIREGLATAANVVRQGWLPCCNEVEQEDGTAVRCQGIMRWPGGGAPEYVCDTCKGRCGWMVHPRHAHDA